LDLDLGGNLVEKGGRSIVCETIFGKGRKRKRRE
jgi:hypothetical protein